MNFEKNDITKLIADAYHEAALDSSNDMFIITELLEKIKRNLVNKSDEPYEAWNGLELDRYRFDKENILKVFVKLKREYYEQHYRNIQKTLDANFDFDLWYSEYIDAVIYLSSTVFVPLSNHNFPFTPEQVQVIKKCRVMNDFILDGRWADVLPIAKELLRVKKLTKYQESCMLVNIGQVQLYWYPDYLDSLKFFEEAKKIDPGNSYVEKGFGTYYLKLQDYDKAISHFQRSMEMDPSDVENYNQIGNCYREMGQYDVAEQWHRNGINYDFTNADSYSRLIQLYGYWDAETEKRKQIPELISKCELLFPDEEFDNILYGIYRDAGFAYSFAGDYTNSALYYKKAIALKPNYTAARIDLAYIHAYDKKYDEAEKILNKVLIDYPDYYDVHWGLAWLYEQLQQFDRAFEEYEKCRAIRPEWADRSYNAIGQLYINIKMDYLTAKQFFAKAAAIRENELLYSDNLLDALDHLDDEQSVNEKTSFLLKRFDKNPQDALLANKIGVHFYEIEKTQEAIPYYKKAIELNPDNNIWYENLALAYENVGKLDEAEHFYKEALARKEEFQTYNRLGIFYFRRNKDSDNEEAIENYRKAIELSPDNPVLFENLGLVYEQNKQLNEAEQAYLKAAEFDDNTGIYFNRLGYFYYSLANDPLAIKYYLKAVEREKDNLLYWKNLALAYEGNKETAKAIDIYLDLLNKNEYDHQVRSLLASAQFSLGPEHYNEALQNLIRCTSEDPENETYRKYLATLYDHLGESEKSIEIFEKLVIEKPEDAGLHNFLGVVYYKAHQYDKAISEYKKAISSDPSIVLYHQNLGLAFELNGQYDEAEDSYLRGLAINPSDDACLYMASVFYSAIRKDYKTALELCNQAIKNNSSNPVYFQNLGDVYSLLNDNKQANIAYAKADELSQALPVK